MFCIMCHYMMDGESSEARTILSTLTDAVSGRLGTVWKLYTRGVPSAATRENRKAKDHWDSATKRGFESILHRYQTDRSYRQCLADERVTYERMIRWNETADPKR